MLKRTLTGAVILLFTAAFVALKQFSSLIFDVFALILTYASMFEVLGAYKKAGKNPHTALLGIVPAFVFAGFYASRKIFAGSEIRMLFGGMFCLMFVAAIMLIAFLTLDIIIASKTRKVNLKNGEIELSENGNCAFDGTKYSMQILAYPILPLSFFFLLNSLPYEISYLGIILTFAISMMTDTFAYLFGRFFGKRKFIPEISPKKTIAGVFGGFVGGIIAAALVFVFFYFAPYFNLINSSNIGLSIAAFAIIAILGSYINQLGDLIASALKRKVGIKDYSNVFPGHGGFMDRVDGQMFVGLFVSLMMILFFV